MEEVTEGGGRLRSFTLPRSISIEEVSVVAGGNTGSGAGAGEGSGAITSTSVRKAL